MRTGMPSRADARKRFWERCWRVRSCLTFIRTRWSLWTTRAGWLPWRWRFQAIVEWYKNIKEDRKDKIRLNEHLTFYWFGLLDKTWESSKKRDILSVSCHAALAGSKRSCFLPFYTINGFFWKDDSNVTLMGTTSSSAQSCSFWIKYLCLHKSWPV